MGDWEAVIPAWCSGCTFQRDYSIWSSGLASNHFIKRGKETGVCFRGTESRRLKHSSATPDSPAKSKGEHQGGTLKIHSKSNRVELLLLVEGSLSQGKGSWTWRGRACIAEWEKWKHRERDGKVWHPERAGEMPRAGAGTGAGLAAGIGCLFVRGPAQMPRWDAQRQMGKFFLYSHLPGPQLPRLGSASNFLPPPIFFVLASAPLSPDTHPGTNLSHTVFLSSLQPHSLPSRPLAFWLPTRGKGWGRTNPRWGTRQAEAVATRTRAYAGQPAVPSRPSGA